MGLALFNLYLILELNLETLNEAERGAPLLVPVVPVDAQITANLKFVMSAS